MTGTPTDALAGPGEPARWLTPAVVEAHLIAEDAVIVDVRDDDELAADGWIAGAVHLPAWRLARATTPEELDGLLPCGVPIACSGSGRRAAAAAWRLRRLGRPEATHLAGGLAAWKRAGLAVVGRKAWHEAHDTPSWPDAPAVVRPVHAPRRST